MEGSRSSHARQRDAAEDHQTLPRLGRGLQVGPLPRAAALATAALLAAGCALGPPAAVRPASPDSEAFAVSGRFAVKHGKDGGSGQLDWRHTPAADELTLRGPLGASIATITREAGVYTLSAPDREPEQALDPDQLTEQALGWRLPLRGLPYWLRGRAEPGVPAETEDKDGAPGVLRQSGWNIEYLSRYPGNGLPERVNLAREDLQIRLILTSWSAAE